MSRMKKYIILYLVTIIAITAIFTIGSVTNAAAEAEIFVLKPQSVENTVSASGRLQYLTNHTVSADNYCLIDKIYVSDGDKVKKGDRLMSVYEIPKTDKIQYSFGDADSLISLISKTALTDELIEKIKEYAVLKTISAPNNGTVSSVAYKENEIVNKNSSLLKISDPDALCVVVNVNESNIGKIKKKQKVKIKFTAVEDKTYQGTVSKIAKEAKQTTGLTSKETSVEVTVKLNNPDDSLRIGYTAECIVTTSVDKDQLIVPYEYIRSDDKGDYVFTAVGKQAVKKYIRTGTEYKKGVAVTSGLKENDKIIKNVNEITDGQKIYLSSGENND